MKHHIAYRSFALAAVSAVAITAMSACGGGGGGSPQLTPPSTAPSTSPTESPTSSPTSSPTGAPASSPQSNVSSINFQSGTAQAFSVTESGYTGTYTESDTCNPLTGQVATVTMSSNTHGAAAFQVSPVGAGTCLITVSDSSGRNVNVSVSVATAAIIVQ